MSTMQELVEHLDAYADEDQASVRHWLDQCTSLWNRLLDARNNLEHS